MDEQKDEERYRIIGRTLSPVNPILFLVDAERYTVDDRQIFRLISARIADKREVKKYERPEQVRVFSAPCGDY